MKLPLFAALAFVVGLAGGTGVGVMRAPKPSAVAASDSARAGGAHGAGSPASADHEAAAATASGQAPLPVTHDSVITTHGAPGGAHDPADAAGVARNAAAAPGVAAGFPHEVASRAIAAHAPEDFQQVARILTTMKPADAAKIMAFLGDDHVEGIIRAVGPRQAAVLMVQLPAQRAAALSKRLIQNPGPEKK